jgi:hypothetical protein
MTVGGQLCINVSGPSGRDFLFLVSCCRLSPLPSFSKPNLTSAILREAESHSA